MEKEKSKSTNYYFSVRDLAIIAVLCSLGGVLSTYVKYLSNVVNIFFGMVQGPGQIMAGLHVFWIILCFGLIRKYGTGTLAGFLKGIVEFLSGNPHGELAVVISLIEGVFIDFGMILFRKKHAKYSYGISAGLGTAGEVVVMYSLTFQMPLWFVIATAILAFCSGLIFGGFFATGTLELLHESKVARIPGWKPKTTKYSDKKPILAKRSSKITRLSKLRIRPFYIAIIIFLLFFSIGGTAYLVTVKPFLKGNSIIAFLDDENATCEVEGEVENSFTYYPKDFTDFEISIRAELQGQVTTEPEKEYSGVPLNIIINKSRPKPTASKIKVIGGDGYTQVFYWSDVKKDNELIVIKEKNSLRLIAANYDGWYWVRDIEKLEVT